MVSLWDWHPEILGGLLFLEGAYLLSVGPLRRRYGWAEEVSRRRIAAFSLGVLSLLAVLQTPIHELSDHYLFSVHMVQHMVLTLVVPPFLLAGTPAWLLRPFLRLPLALPALRLATKPLIAIVLSNGIFWLWHLQTLYSWTLNNHWAHILQHLLYIGSAVIAWWPVLSPLPALPRLSYPGQILYLFVLSIPPALLGGVITFTTKALYPEYVAAPRVWGLSAVADQQIGGLIMKVVGGLGFLVAPVFIFLHWFQRDEVAQMEQRQEWKPVAAEEELPSSRAIIRGVEVYLREQQELRRQL